MKDVLNLTMIDDDPNFLRVMSLSLGDDCHVTTYVDPEVALMRLRENLPDAVLLDLHMNELDGFSVCEKIREIHSTLPVFFLTSDERAHNIGRGFETGGIDYFFKGMPLQELKSRIRGRLRSLPSPKTEPRFLTCRDIALDLRSRELILAGKKVIPTPKEFDLLKVFLEHQDEVLSKATLLSLLWSDVHVNAGNIDTHIFHLRKKFNDLTIGIETRKGCGYILRSRI